MSNLLEQVKSIEEGFASDAQRRAAFASGYKEKGKKKKEEEAVSPAQQAAIAISKKEKAKKEGIELDEYLTADEKKLIAKMYDKKGNLTPLGKKVMDYKIKKEEVEENTLDIENESDYTLDEGKMKELHGYISSGKSAEQIAKIMKLDVKTIKALMKEETDIDELSLSVKDIQKSGVRKQDTSKLKKDLQRLKKGLKKEDTELDESMEDEFGEKFQSRRPSSKDVKMAIGIANDPRYKGGNMTGAVKAIEKIRDGLSNYPEVAAALRKANEDVELDEITNKFAVVAVKSGDVLGFSSHEKDANDMARNNLRKEKGKVVKLKRGIATNRASKMIGRPLEMGMAEEVELDEAGSQGMFLVIQGKNDNKQKVVSMHKRKADAIKARDAWNDKNKPEKRTHKARVYAVGKFATTDGKPNTYKVGDNVMYSDFARSIVKEDIEIDEASMKIGSIDFELFDDMKGAKQANAAMNKEIAKAAKMKDYKSARTYMNKVQDKYQKFGAGDSEPERTIDAVLAKSFSNDPDRRKHSFDFRREDVEVIDGYFQETKSSTGYELFHRDFSGAMQHAYAHAKKKFGITIDKDEIDDKVAMGPRKPSKGKTNSYRLRGDKGNIQVQVYNMGSKFELNMYKESVDEEVDLDELTIADVKKATAKAKKRQEKERKTTGKTSVSTADLAARKKNKKEEVEIDEASKEGTMRVIDLARQNNPEVRKHLNVANAGNKGYQVQRMTKGKFVNQGKPYSKLKDAQKVQQGGQHSMQFETIDESVKYGGIPAGLSKKRIKADRDVYAQVLGIKEAIDPADFDISATSKDVEKADQNIMIQLQKVITLRGQKPVEFGDGKKQKVHPNVASAALSMHRKLRRTDEKDAFQRKIGKSYRDLLNAVKGK